MGSSAKSHTYNVLRNRAREADAQVVNVHLDGRLYRREGHLFHPVGHAKRALRARPAAPTALPTPGSAARGKRGRGAAPAEPAFEPLKAVPAGVQIGLEKFLLGGILVLLVAFVGIGCAITLEAFAAAKQEPLDPALQSFIVDQLEPKFTPLLGAGFACSILLGGLKTLQLTSDGGQYSEGATYTEDD